MPTPDTNAPERRPYFPMAGSLPDRLLRHLQANPGASLRGVDLVSQHGFANSGSVFATLKLAQRAGLIQNQDGLWSAGPHLADWHPDGNPRPARQRPLPQRDAQRTGGPRPARNVEPATAHQTPVQDADPAVTEAAGLPDDFETLADAIDETTTTSLPPLVLYTSEARLTAQGIGELKRAGYLPLHVADLRAVRLPNAGDVGA